MIVLVPVLEIGVELDGDREYEREHEDDGEAESPQRPPMKAWRGLRGGGVPGLQTLTPTLFLGKGFKPPCDFRAARLSREPPRLRDPPAIGKIRGNGRLSRRP
jgi:hypothetical protein